jgi:hypothetical protein
MHNEFYSYKYGGKGGSASVGGEGFAIAGRDGNDFEAQHFAGAIKDGEFVQHKADGSCCATGEPELTDNVLFGLHGSDDHEEEFNRKLGKGTRLVAAALIVVVLIVAACTVLAVIK